MFEFGVDKIVDKYYNFLQDAMSYQIHHFVRSKRTNPSKSILKRNLFIWSECVYRDRPLHEVAEEYDMKPLKVLRIAKNVDRHMEIFLEREAA